MIWKLQCRFIYFYCLISSNKHALYKKEKKRKQINIETKKVLKLEIYRRKEGRARARALGQLRHILGEKFKSSFCCCCCLVVEKKNENTKI